MAIPFTCRSEVCGKNLQVGDELAGKSVRCPYCGAVQTVPPRALPVSPAIDLVQPSPSPPNAPGEVLEVIALPNPQAEAVPTRSGIRERQRYARRSRPPDDVLCPYCRRDIDPTEEECPECERSLTERDLVADYDQLKKQRKRYQLLSFVFGLPGLALGVGGGILRESDPLLGSLLMLTGGILLWIGIGFGVAYKRYNLVWILLGFLGILGLIILAFLPDEKRKRLRRMDDLLDARE